MSLFTDGTREVRFERLDGKLYYFTPGGFLYRRDPGTQEVGGYFCGYLPGEVWRYTTDDG